MNLAFTRLCFEQVTEGESHIDEDWKQLKEAIQEAAEQTIGYQPKPDGRGWFDDKCHRALEEKIAAYKKWIDRPTRAKGWNTKDRGRQPTKYVKARKEHIWIIV